MIEMKILLKTTINIWLSTVYSVSLLNLVYYKNQTCCLNERSEKKVRIKIQINIKLR